MFTLLSSAQSIMLLALVSSLSRAGLNVVDRYQIGFRELSIRQVNLWNNVIPTLLMVILLLFFGLGHEFLKLLISWKTICFSGLVQLVAYAFSFGFRHLNVNQVTATAKLSDIFIPIGIFIFTSHWSWSNYSFAILTTLVCLPILWKKKKISASFDHGGLFIIGALVLQASVAPLLIETSINSSVSFQHLFLFTISVLFWRSIWTILPLFCQKQSMPIRWDLSYLNYIFLLRVILTILTQVSFIVAIASPHSLVAWPILNSTGLFALFFSKQFLKEYHTRKEQGIVIAISFLELIRFVSL